MTKSANLNIYILAGGVGSRFWPQSRNDFPKQFLDILGTGASLLQQTFNRFSSFVPTNNLYVITNDKYSSLVQEQLPELPEQNIICEPTRNNTAPCIAYAAFKLYKDNPDAVMAVVPSDHLVLKEDRYRQLMQKAAGFAAKEEGLVTLGIKPTRPDTGYGYIEFSEEQSEQRVYPVRSFKEKPDIETAAAYLETGGYLWNAGMFVWKVSTIIQTFQSLCPEIFSLFEKGLPFLNTSKEKDFIQREYPKSPNVSIDFAVMEKSNKVYTIPADIGWSDLGTWDSLFNVFPNKDENNNALLADTTYLANTRNCLINTPEKKLIVVDGLDNYIVVDNDNVLLIYPKNKEQKIKQVTGNLKKKKLGQYL